MRTRSQEPVTPLTVVCGSADGSFGSVMSPVCVNALVPSGKPVAGCVGVDVPRTVQVDPFHASHDRVRSVDGVVGTIAGTGGSAMPPTGGLAAGLVTSTLSVVEEFESASGSSIRKKNVSPK